MLKECTIFVQELEILTALQTCPDFAHTADNFMLMMFCTHNNICKFCLAGFISKDFTTDGK